MFEGCFRYLHSLLKMIFHNSGVVWSENLLKKWKNSDLSRCSKISFEDFFKRYFYVCFDIFISTSRTTLIFLPTHSLMFGECFWYLQSVLKMSFHNSGVAWNEKFLKKWQKFKSFEMLQKIWIFAIFWGTFHFKRLQNCGKSFSTHFEGTRNILRTSRNASAKKLESYDS